MIESTDIYSGPYLTDGSVKIFPVTFPFSANAHLAVYQVDIATGTPALLVLDSDYSVTGAGEDEGGTVTTLAEAAIADGYKIAILRNIPLTQPLSISNQTTYYPEILEAELDRIVQQMQMLQEQINRATLAEIGSATGVEV